VSFRIETRYTRTAQLDWTEVVTCPHCGAKWKGGVISRGRGSDQTWHGMGAESAIENAGIDAFSRAVDAGKAALLRARCPRCHKRGGGVVSLAIKTALLYGFLAALFIWVAREMGHGGMWSGGSSPALPPILIALALVMVPLTVSGVLRSVDQRVRFEPLEQLRPQPAAPPPAPPPRPRQAPAPRAPAAPAAPADPADPDGLELDLDRSWNKKG
jgi:hypothetical protein